MEALTRGLAAAGLLLAAACAEDLIGPPARISVAPRDTTLYVRGSMVRRDIVVGALRVDRPDDDIRYSTPDTSVVSVTRAGVTTGRSYGRARIVMLSGGIADTAWVSVVPTGTVVFGERYGATVAVVELDGSGFRRIANSGQSGAGAPDWSPDGAAVVFASLIPGGAGASTLMVASADGGLSVPVAGAAGNFPRFSRDGSWIYYRSSASGGEGEIWRTSPDGARSERIGPADASFAGDSYPDPSPDGGSVLLSTDREAGGWHLVVRSVSQGTDHSLGVQGLSPRWSAAGDRIAYWAGDQLDGRGAIYVMNADGSGSRQVSPPGRVYRVPGLDWSPDGRWLLAQGDSLPELLDLATGNALPLAFTQGATAAAWKP